MNFLKKSTQEYDEHDENLEDLLSTVVEPVVPPVLQKEEEVGKKVVKEGQIITAKEGEETLITPSTATTNLGKKPSLSITIEDDYNNFTEEQESKTSFLKSVTTAGDIGVDINNQNHNKDHTEVKETTEPSFENQEGETTAADTSSNTPTTANSKSTIGFTAPSTTLTTESKNNSRSTSSDSVVVISSDIDDSNLNRIPDSDLNSECGMLHTISMDTIDRSSGKGEEEGVVFMGWKSSTNMNDTNMAVSGMTSVEPKAIGATTAAVPGKLKKRSVSTSSTASSKSDKPKKNLWKGVLALAQRSPSNNKKRASMKREQQGMNIVKDFNKIHHNDPSPSDDKSLIRGTSSSSNHSRSGSGNENKSAFMSVLDAATDAINYVNTEIKANNLPFYSKVIEDDDDVDINDADADNPDDDVNDDEEEDSDEKQQGLELLQPFRDTNYDVKSTSPVKQQKRTFGRQKNIKPKNVKPSRASVKKSQSKSIMSEDSRMQKEFVQIKPFYAYPEGFQMSDAELYQEMMHKSSNVETLILSQLSFRSVRTKNESKVTTESNDRKQEQSQPPIGTLEVEVLSCMGLPQFKRSKPNAIAYLVCGDVAFATDIIHSSLSPMWPARSKHAAVFPIFHAYAHLYTGIFNVTDKDNDDYIGRSVIDIATLRSNMHYDVSLPLKKSGIVYDREPRGVVRLRFHLTWNTESAPLLSYLPSKMSDIFVNVKEPLDLVTIPCADPKSLRNVAFTTHGEDLPGKYTKKAWRSINRELICTNFKLL